MIRQSVVFAGPREVSVEDTPVSSPGGGEALMETLVSAISAGTEMLVYRDQFPQGLSIDETLDGMGDAFAYPLQYGYAVAGRVVACGEDVEADWEGRLVFAFQPHASHFTLATSHLMPVPSGIGAEEAVFLPNMETAVNLVQDGAPLLGERVVVLGQGIVGLLTTALLARFPLDRLIAVDSYAKRREAAMSAGADAALAPEELNEFAEDSESGRADLVFELSGNPDALNQAVAVTRYGGRIVVGSWYGQKRAALDLGGRFHRNRIRLVSSQVSTIAPELRGRWDKRRRYDAAWRMIEAVGPGRWITQRYPVSQAAEAYRLLDEESSEAIQVLLTYDPQ